MSARQLLDRFRARIVVVAEGRDGELLCLRIQREIQAADMAAVDMTCLRPFFQLGMVNRTLTRGTAPRHTGAPPMRSVRNPQRGRLRNGCSENSTFPANAMVDV